MPDLVLELAALRRGFAPVCGVDEVGRGPWAGPVVAGAVILGDLMDDAGLIGALDDSKKLTAKRREALAARIEEGAPGAIVGIGLASPSEIDALNILRATWLAMQRAVAALRTEPAYALVDGNRLPELPCPAEAIVKGDGISASISAASIVAKVARDRIMADLARDHPGYGWERNAGYGTAEHTAALHRLGVTVHHRRSFRPVRELLVNAK